MITRLIELAARQRVFVLVLGVALAIGGAVALRHVKLDAIPDLSDTQVIVFTEWPGRAPQLIEDQITYPLVTALLGAPRVAEVRGQSMFGMSFVYVVFDEDVDPYWGRARVLELLSSAAERLPEGVAPRLGPDASGVGWIYQYALVDRENRHDLGALRQLHDFQLRYALASVEGVAEVATVGGFEPQYQVTLDPVRLRALGVSLAEVADAVRAANGESGGRVLELSEREHFVRGRGYVERPADLEAAVVRATADGRVVRVGDLGTVQLGAEQRRGAADWMGLGETVSGIVVMRHGENARDVIQRVEARLAELAPALPDGVELVEVYDRSGLIDRALDTLRGALLEEMTVVAAVILLFLLHLRSALLPIITLPLAVLTAFIPMALFGVPATIMSLGGIAIALGATVDAEIVMIEAAHKRLEHAPPDLSPEARRHLLAEAGAEVTPAIFTSLLVIAISFLPVFALNGQAGRLFWPLAFTKTAVMLSAALLSVTLAPALRDVLLTGPVRAEADHPISRAIRAVYAPFVHVALENPRTTLLIGAFAVLSAVPLVPRLGSEFMPPLDEGDLLYMPTTFPGISIEEAKTQLQLQDQLLASIPEVEVVLGKVGRAESPTDPAPLSMVETVVKLKPRSAWRTRFTRRWYHGWTTHPPLAWARPALEAVWPEFVPLTREDLVTELNAKLNLPGWTNAFTQPIRNRVDMLATGIRTAVGVKVYGARLAEVERTGVALEALLRGLPGTRSALFERQEGGLYVDVTPDRAKLARLGLSVADVNALVEVAIGGQPVTTVIDGRARIGVNVRYAADFRGSVEALSELLLPLPGREGGGARHVRLGEVATVAVRPGPPMIRDDAGSIVGYVFVDLTDGVDLGGWVERAEGAVSAAVDTGALPLPPGGRLRFTGQYELLRAMEARMKLLVPLALLLVVLLLYAQFGSLTEVAIVLASVPFALVGAIWALYLLDYRLSTAVWVGVIALIGLAAQTGVVMIVYIDHAYHARKAAGVIRTPADIVEAHAEGTIARVRPKLMTVGTMLVGLVPLLWADGSGADVMKRIAAPMVGGLLSSLFLTLELIPVVYTAWRTEQLVLEQLEARAPAEAEALRGLVRWMQLGVLGAVAIAASWLIVDAPSRAHIVSILTPCSVAAASAIGYLAARTRFVRTWEIAR